VKDQCAKEMQNARLQSLEKPFPEIIFMADEELFS
jgi:hypothetical protein